MPKGLQKNRSEDLAFQIITSQLFYLLNEIAPKYTAIKYKKFCDTLLELKLVKNIILPFSECNFLPFYDESKGESKILTLCRVNWHLWNFEDISRKFDDVYICAVAKKIIDFFNAKRREIVKQIDECVGANNSKTIMTLGTCCDRSAITLIEYVFSDKTVISSTLPKQISIPVNDKLLKCLNDISNSLRNLPYDTRNSR